MSSPLQYKVRMRERGNPKLVYLANFRCRVDAVNYAAAESRGRYNGDIATVIAYDADGKVFMKFHRGERV